MYKNPIVTKYVVGASPLAALTSVVYGRSVTHLSERSDSSRWGGCLLLCALSVTVDLGPLGEQAAYLGLVAEGAVPVLRP